MSPWRAAICALLVLALFSCKAKEEAKPEAYTVLDHGDFVFVVHGGLHDDVIPEILARLRGEGGRMKADLGLGADTGQVTIHIRTDPSEHLDTMKKLIYGRYPGVTAYVVNARRIELLYCSTIVQDALHEYAHCLSLLLNRKFANNPRWLWEAVAAYESGEFFEPREVDFLAEGRYPSLEELGEDIGADDRIYKVGYLLVEYIQETWGREKLVELIKSGGELLPVLGLGQADFERAWRAFVERKYLRR